MSTATRALLPYSDSPDYRAAAARDLKRLQAFKDWMAALPPKRRKAVAERLLAMNVQRRLGVKPTYSDMILGNAERARTKICRRSFRLSDALEKQA